MLDHNPVELLEEEVIQLLRDELTEWYVSYLVFKSLVGDEFQQVVEKPWRGKTQEQIDHQIYYKYRAGLFWYSINVARISRTKAHFYINFPLDEYDIVIQVQDLLNGFVDYTFGRNANKQYAMSFTVDFGSKAYCQEFFTKIKDC